MPRGLRRRTVLLGGLATGVAAIAGGVDLVAHGILPGQHDFDQITGGCDVGSIAISFGEAGPTTSGTFFSHYRRTTVGWTISYPPGTRVGDRLPMMLALHGFGGSHLDPVGPMTPAQLLSTDSAPGPMPKVAIASADGGNGYWHAHPGDDPMGMLLHEFLPLCARHGLDLANRHGLRKGIGVIGTSMGGYGALLLAEEQPQLVSTVAAISPAVWTTYAQAHGADAGAFASAEDFASNDVITNAGALKQTLTRVCSGNDDPFQPGVKLLAQRLPSGAVSVFSKGCHDRSFFGSQAPASVAFVGDGLVARSG